MHSNIGQILVYLDKLTFYIRIGNGNQAQNNSASIPVFIKTIPRTSNCIWNVKNWIEIRFFAWEILYYQIEVPVTN